MLAPSHHGGAAMLALAIVALVCAAGIGLQARAEFVAGNRRGVRRCAALGALLLALSGVALSRVTLPPPLAWTPGQNGLGEGWDCQENVPPEARVCFKTPPRGGK